MKRKILAWLLTINFLILNLFSLNAFAASKLTPQITGLNSSYASGAMPSIYILTNGYKGKVQYRIVLNNLVTNKSIDITKGYTKAVMNSAKQKVVLPKLSDGYYRVFVYVKKPGSKASYDGYLVKSLNVYLNSLTITKEGLTAGSIKPNLPQLVKNDVNIKADEVVYKNARVNGDLYVNSNNVSLENVKVEGKVYLDPGFEGNAALEKVSAGEIIVLSGGSNSIHFKDVTADNLKIDAKSNVRVVVNESKISNVNINTPSILQNEGTSFENIEVNTNDSSQAVEFRGSIDTKIVVKGESYIKSSEKINDLEISTEKADSKVIVEANVNNINVLKDSSIELKGSSKVEGTIFVRANSSIKAEKNAFVDKVEVLDTGKTVKAEGKINLIELKAESKLELNNAEIKTLVANSKAEVVANKDSKVEKLDGTKKEDIKVSGEGQVPKGSGNTGESGSTGGNGSTGGSTGTGGTGNIGGNTGGGIVNVPVSNIVINDSVVLLNKGEELDVDYSIEPVNATNKTLNWSIDNESIAQVTDGKIKAKSVGEATITVKTPDNKISKVLKIKVIDSGITVNIKKEAGKVAIYVKSKNSNEIVTLKITQNDNIRYIDQINLNNNTQKLTTILENGQFKLYVKGLNSEVITIDFTIN